MKSQTSLLAYIQDLLGQDFNIALFLSIVRKSLIWVLLMVLLGLAGVWLYLRYTLPIYEANSTLMMKREQSMKDQLFGSNNVLAANFEEASMEIQLIRSKFFVQRVIAMLPFDISYFKEGRTKLVSTELYTATPFVVDILEIKDNAIYGKDIYIDIQDSRKFIMRYKIDELEYRESLTFNNYFETPHIEIKVSLTDRARASVSEYAGKPYFFRINELERYAEMLSANVKVLPIDPSTKTIGIKYQDKNPVKARDLANALAREFVVYDVERQAESADQILNFLESELDTFNKVLAIYLDSLREYRLRRKFLEPEQEMNSLINGLRSLEQQKLNNMFEMKVLDWFHEYIGNLSQIESVSSGLLGSELSNINGYINNIKGLERQKETLLLNVSSDHPNVKIIEDNIIRTKNEMLNDLDNIKLQKNYKIQSIDEQYFRYLERLLLLPEEQEEFSRLRNKYNEVSSYYKKVSDKHSDYRVSKAGMVSDYIVLNFASIPQKAIGLNESLLWTIAVSVALVLGLILIVLRYLLHDTIISIETITKKTKASILGIVPSVFTEMPVSAIVVTQNPKSVITEAFRVLRNNLHFISNAPGPKTLAFTSTVSGEGKTFISINMGAILSLLDKKVILLDVDMRRPRLSKIFNVDNVSGMSTILIGRDSVDDCIRKTELKNLDFVTSGPIPPNPAELILSDRLNEMIEYLKTKYDYIIFDTPPLGLVTDGFELIKQVDYPVYVLRAEYSSRTFVDNVSKLFNDNKITKLSVVLNDVGRGVSGYTYGSYSYKYGYSYGYSYGYGSKDSGYYSEDTQAKKSFLRKIFRKSS